jgi:hypothetical protein
LLESAPHFLRNSLLNSYSAVTFRFLEKPYRSNNIIWLACSSQLPCKCGDVLELGKNAIFLVRDKRLELNVGDFEISSPVAGRIIQEFLVNCRRDQVLGERKDRFWADRCTPFFEKLLLRGNGFSALRAEPLEITFKDPDLRGLQFRLRMGCYGRHRFLYLSLSWADRPGCNHHNILL